MAAMRYLQLEDDVLLAEWVQCGQELETLRAGLRDMRLQQASRRTAWETVQLLEAVLKAAEARHAAIQAELLRRGLRTR